METLEFAESAIDSLQFVCDHDFVKYVIRVASYVFEETNLSNEGKHISQIEMRILFNIVWSC